MKKYKNIEFDIVIPVHKKDLAVLEYCIEAAKNKIIGVRKIFIVSKERYSENAEWVDEASFPFSIELAKSYVGTSCGWYFQQMLKMYAPLVIPGITENVLILDSDTVFFRKVSMFDSEGRPLYNISKDTKLCRRSFDQLVAAHIRKLLPSIATENLPEEFQTLSGISHNMIFNQKILRELFKKIEDHDASGDPFYKIFFKNSGISHGASEYQIYFCFLLVYHRNEVGFRRLRYKNTADLNIKKYRRRLKYHYCSFHSYLRSTVIKSWRMKLRKIINKLFFIDKWNCGIANCGIENFLTLPNQKINWLASVSSLDFRADPFGIISHDAKKHIFFEDYSYLKRKGEIIRAEIDDNFNILNKTSLLTKPYHLSYPYIFENDGENFMLVESYKAKKLELYKITKNLGLEKVKDLLSNLEIVDPSIIKFNEIWWLFFNLNNEGDGKLHLAYSDNLLGEWKMHPKNPIKDNISSARSAGKIFLHNGSLYRPAQNCQFNYGNSIVINKITTLDSQNYEEQAEIEIHPNQLGHYPDGLHNISPLGKNLTLIDGKKKIFVFYKPLIALFRVFYKNFL